MRMPFYYLIFFCLLFYLGACIDEIKLNVDTEQRTLVVDGFVTDSLGDFQLKLSQSSVIGIGNDNILDPESGATVNLLDTDGGSYPYAESAADAGIYILEQFKVERGKQYFIDIVLQNGKHYQSTPSQLRSSSKIDNISYTVFESTYRNNIGDLVTDELISLNIDTDVRDAESPPFLRWRVEGQYVIREISPGNLNPKRCFVTNNLDQNVISVFDASLLNEGVLRNQEIASTILDFRFTENFCFHISQYAISEEEFDYWNSIKEVIEIDGSLFDPPPGTVIGNIRNVDNPEEIAVGYFSVASIFFLRDFINGDELGNSIAPKCGRRGEVPFGCDNCLDINNSTTEVPTYWEL